MMPFLLQVSHLPRQYLHATSSQPSGVPSLNEILEPAIYLALQITERREQEGWVTSNLWALYAKHFLSRKGGRLAKVKDFPLIWQKLVCWFLQHSACGPKHALGQTWTALPGVPEAKYITV